VSLVLRSSERKKSKKKKLKLNTITIDDDNQLENLKIKSPGKSKYLELLSKKQPINIAV
jgi:hypothetical protein